MIRIDLHTHSEASIDGGISPEEYADILKNEKVDVIAITDHNRIDFAKGMKKAFGEEYVIVGEEISTTDGDIIGLYLNNKIEPGQNVEETINEIHAQGGIVYIPHPFEKVRKGISRDVLSKILNKVDIIEAHNGRALSKKNTVELETIGVKNNIAFCGSSDAHGIKGVGKTYSTIALRPTKENLVELLKNGAIVNSRPPIISYFYPKINRFKNYLKGQ
jgi:predicted metal-dependent phosphoesterase TrpH